MRKNQKLQKILEKAAEIANKNQKIDIILQILQIKQILLIISHRMYLVQYLQQQVYVKYKKNKQY